MTPERFMRIVQDAMTRSLIVLEHKAKEYSWDGDRLSNFKKAGALQGCAPEAALLGMLVKHWVSICEMVQDLGQGKHWPQEVWQEKLGDNINYSYLLEALLEERYGWDQTEEET